MSLFAPGAAAPGRPYWWETGAPLPELPAEPPPRTELLVIGAGYTGLSAAITAADAGAEVVVIDAGVPGQGASTRNGGMVGAHPRLPFSTVVARFGLAAASGLYAEARPAFEHVAGLIEREAIACEFRRTGRIQLAWTPADAEAQRAQVADITAISDIRMEFVPRDELGAEIATSRYFGGIRFPDHGAFDPRRFHDGLLAAALRRGVRIVGNCPVARLRPAGAGFIADTAQGTVSARRVVLATNGTTTGDFAWFRRRVFALPSFIMATEPQDPALLARLAPGGRMMVETRARHCYYRLSPDGTRVLFGGRAAMVPLAPEVAAQRLQAAMTGIWPDLSGARLTHAWSGFTGFSFAQLPHVGAHGGVHYAMGYSGSGTALAPWLGAKAAWRALGDPRGATAYAATRLVARPYHPFGRPLFLRAANLWYRRVVDPLQDRAAR